MNKREVLGLIDRIARECGWEPDDITDVTLHVDGAVTCTKVAVRRDLACMDCKRPDPEYYMVHRSLWDEAVDPQDTDRHLCLACLGARLGRAITVDDLIDEAWR